MRNKPYFSNLLRLFLGILSVFFLLNMVKSAKFIFCDASRLFWFKSFIGQYFDPFYTRSFSSQTKYTGEFWKAYAKMVYRNLNLFFYLKSIIIKKTT